MTFLKQFTKEKKNLNSPPKMLFIITHVLYNIFFNNITKQLMCDHLIINNNYETDKSINQYLPHVL